MTPTASDVNNARTAEEAAVLLFQMGFVPIRVRQGEKTPADLAWQQTVYANEAAVREKFKGWPGNVGVLTNGMLMLGPNTQAAYDALKAAFPFYDATLARQGNNPFPCAILKRSDSEPFWKGQKIQTNDDALKTMADLWGDSCQFVAWGDHPAGVRYRFVNENPILSISSADAKRLCELAVEKMGPGYRLKTQPKALAQTQRATDEKNIFASVKARVRMSEVLGTTDTRIMCPLHVQGSSNPAAVIYENPDGDVVYCHSSGCFGDVIKVYAHQHGLGQYDAAVELAKSHGIELPKTEKPKSTTTPPTNSVAIVPKTLKEILSVKKNRAFLVDGFLYRPGLVLIYSEPGLYKSFLSLGVGVALASGRPFAGMQTKRTPVLICDNENAEEDIRTRVELLMAGQEIKRKSLDIGFLVRAGSFDDPNFYRQLIGLVEKNKYGLVVVDTLRRFTNANENESTAMNTIYQNVFGPLVREHKATVMLLHHQSKNGTSRGSVDLPAMCDVVMRVQYAKGRKKTDAQPRIELTTEKTRYAGALRFGFDIRANTENGSLWFSQVGEEELAKADTEEKLKRRNLEEVILKLFPDATKILNRAHIGALLEENADIGEGPAAKKAINRALASLVYKKHLMKPKEGQYRLYLAPETGQNRL